MNTNLYTIILEYKRGTYISQVKASGSAEALQAWACSFVKESIRKIPKNIRQSLVDSLKEDDEKATPLNGITNVWCAVGYASGNMGLINIIKTSEKKESKHSKRKGTRTTIQKMPNKAL